LRFLKTTGKQQTTINKQYMRRVLGLFFCLLFTIGLTKHQKYQDTQDLKFEITKSENQNLAQEEGKENKFNDDIDNIIRTISVEDSNQANNINDTNIKKPEQKQNINSKNQTEDEKNDNSISKNFIFQKQLTHASSNDIIGGLYDTNQSPIQPIRVSTFEKLKQQKIYNDSCNIILNRLVEIKLVYLNSNYEIKEDGIMISFDILAPYITSIFKDLLEQKFIVYGIDPFKGVTTHSRIFFNTISPDKDYNYSGSFSCRGMQSNLAISSSHSLGSAIDINPLLNPYIEISKKTKKITRIIPEDGIFNLNRYKQRPGKKTREGIIDDKIVSIFKKYGFNIWGGYWDEPIDYHHFQIPKYIASFLPKISPEDGVKVFDLHVDFQRCDLKKPTQTNLDIFSYMIQFCIKSKECSESDTPEKIYLSSKDKFFSIANTALNDYCKEVDNIKLL